MDAPSIHFALKKPKTKLWLTIGLFVGGFIGAVLANGLNSLTDDPKAIIGCLTAALSVSGLGYCIIDAIWGNNRPHMYSWLIWFIVNSVAWYNQWTHEAGPGAWSTLVMTILSGLVFCVALYQHVRKISDQPLTAIDQWCLAGAIVSVAFLVIFHTGPASIIAATITDAFAFIPTFKKVWHKPQSETSVNYSLNTIRHIIAMFAMESYNLMTLLFPASLIALNGLMVTVIALRRRRKIV